MLSSIINTAENKYFKLCFKWDSKESIGFFLTIWQVAGAFNKNLITLQAPSVATTKFFRFRPLAFRKH